MGFLSDITDSLFGDSGKGASKSQGKENERNREFIRAATQTARADIDRIFPQVQSQRLGGFQGAQNVLAQGIPQQFDIFQQGNIQAQQTAGLAPQQIQNALLGIQPDFGFLQPGPAQQPDFSFLSQPLVGQPTQEELLAQQAAQQQPQLPQFDFNNPAGTAAFGGFPMGRFNTGLGGPF